MACKLSRQARREPSKSHARRAAQPPASQILLAAARGRPRHFVRSLHDRVAALAMRGHTVTVQIILRQMHCENQDRNQPEI